MNTNYLAVVSCLDCGEMIITKPDGSIFCACTTKRFCKHPAGMSDCHECYIATLERQLAEERGKLLAIKGRLLEIVEECEEIGEDPSYLFSMLDAIDPNILESITPNEGNE